MRYKPLFIILILTISIGLTSCSMFTKEPLSVESIQQAETPASSPQISLPAWINLESVQNARQLGGYKTTDNRTVKQNIIIRSGELAGLSDNDKKLLTDEYNLAYIIDLRDEIEVPDAPDPELPGVDYHNLIVWPREVRNRISLESKTNEEYVKNYYTAYALGNEAIEAFQKMFEVLLENESGSVLIHCMYGRDRTGIAVTLILSALQVDWDDIEREYLLSSGADISSLQYYKSVVEENFGSMENYLKTVIKLSDDDIVLLKEKYTTSIE